MPKRIQMQLKRQPKRQKGTMKKYVLGNMTIYDTQLVRLRVPSHRSPKSFVVISKVRPTYIEKQHALKALAAYKDIYERESLDVNLMLSGLAKFAQ